MNSYKQTILFVFIIIGFAILLSNCKPNFKIDTTVTTSSIDSLLLDGRYQKLLDYPIDSMAFPRSYNSKKASIKKVPSKDWVSGFFPGNLWQIFELTQDDRYKEAAKKWTAFVEKEKFNNRTHDVGFKVFCSFGQGLKHENNPTYKKIIVRSV